MIIHYQGLGATADASYAPKDMLGIPVVPPTFVGGEDSRIGLTPDGAIWRSMDPVVAAGIVTSQRNMRYIVAASAFGVGAVVFGALGFFLGRRR